MSYSTVTNYNAGDTVSASVLNALFSDIETLISDSTIVAENISSKARIPNSALDKTTQLIPICFSIGKVQYAVPIYASATKPVMVIPFHITSRENAAGKYYGISHASYMITDDGGGTLAYTIKWGYHEDGLFVSDDDTIHSGTIDAAGGIDRGATTTITFSSPAFRMTERPRCFALFITTLDGTAHTNATSAFNITFHVEVETTVL